MAWLEDQAGYTRTGYHRGSGAESRAELGKWQHAGDWVRASFAQHTSRAGDPQLHEHNLVLNLVPTEIDGKWRRLDSKGLYRHKVAFSAIVAAEMERMVTARYGVAWVPRIDGHGREIAGVTQKAIEEFSARRKTITQQAAEVAVLREAEWGRKPDARQMDRIMRDVTQRTRKGKEETPLDLVCGAARVGGQGPGCGLGLAVRHLRLGHDRSPRPGRAGSGGEWAGPPDRLAACPRARRGAGRGADGADRGVRPVDHPARGAERPVRLGRAGAQLHPDPGSRPARGAGHSPRDRAGAGADAETLREQARERAAVQACTVAYPVPGVHGLSELEARQMMAEAVAVLQTQRPTWTKSDLIGVIGQRLPADAHASRVVLETLAERALAGEAGERVALLSAPEWPVVPPSLRRPDGESVFRPHGAERYASQAQLALEEQLLALAQATGAPRLRPDEAARAARRGAGSARHPAHAGRPDSGARRGDRLGAADGPGCRRVLHLDLAAACRGAGRPARHRQDLHGHGHGPRLDRRRDGAVVALTTSNNARNVIREEAARHGVTLQAAQHHEMARPRPGRWASAHAHAACSRAA